MVGTSLLVKGHILRKIILQTFIIELVDCNEISATIMVKVRMENEAYWSERLLHGSTKQPTVMFPYFWWMSQ